MLAARRELEGALEGAEGGPGGGGWFIFDGLADKIAGLSANEQHSSAWVNGGRWTVGGGRWR